MDPAQRQRLAELFGHAIDVPPAERAAWLDAQCRHDSELRAELERLLRADARASAFMETPPEQVSAVADAATATIATKQQHQFGPYRVLRSIGVGGMGEVWLAERNDGEFEQRVAIKQLAYPTPGLLQRFRQERQILARLEHPNIARLIDGGVDAAGAPYLAMEYVEGQPITEYVRAHGLDLRARLELVLRVCAAVQYAHQNLVVHRDLKPSNIFVTADATPKLLDFGIAKVLATTDAAAPTQTAARLLTPDYAAPEQFSGGTITTATDVYALGVVLYELLADARPQRPLAFGATSAHAIALTERPPPSAAIERTTSNAAARRRALRGDLDRIALTALAIEPQRRYPSAEALSADIRRYLEGRPIAARGDSAWYRMRKFSRRNRYALAAALFVFVVCVSATIVSVHQARVAREHAARAEAVRAFMVGVFQQAHPDENQGQPITAHQLLEKGEQQLALSAAGKQPAIQADLTGLIGSLYWNIGDYARAQALLKQALAALADPRVPDEIKARNLVQLASTEAEQSTYALAMEHAQQALALAPPGSKESADARRLVASVLTNRGDANQAEPALRELLAADRAEPGDRTAALAEDWALLAHALDELSRYDESVLAEREALQLDRSLHGERSTAVADDLNDLGLALSHKGDYLAAETALQQALDMKGQLYGRDHRETLVGRANLFMAQEKQGRYAEGLQGRLQLLQDQQRVLSQSHPDQIARTYNMIGLDYIMLGRFDESVTAFRQALATWAGIEGSGDEDRVGPLGNLAIALQMQGRYADAETTLRDTLAIERKQYPASSEWLNQDRGYLGNLLRLQHRYPDALRELSEAIAAVKTAVSDADPVLALLHAQLSEAQLDAGDAATAQATAGIALEIARKSLPERNIGLSNPLFALARADLALEQAASAEPLLREALAVRSPSLAANDPRVLEIKTALVNALTMLKKTDAAQALRREIEPLLRAANSPYAADLQARMAQP